MTARTEGEDSTVAQGVRDEDTTENEAHGRMTHRHHRRQNEEDAHTRIQSHLHLVAPVVLYLHSKINSARGDGAAPAEPVVEKQKPNFNATGLLAKEANTVAGTNTVLKYHEPPEARKPSSKEQWRMFVFKGKDMIDTIHLYSRSCWLMGRDQAIVDFQLEHPSISKQHAVIQFRHITKTNEYGDKLSKVKPYLIDLDSANGTRLNGEKIGGSRYIELRDGDVVGFGDSEREYVMMLPK
ncbi:unnamed protein product [Aureobasidium mustum]|uniref:FHA domain-containing protein n=1 Tax=Aureobasidium mustum TaxID=2773714 RepID=A0A9N8P803_9PEZI|nr:unnamed protein product [Aureobasidium mustum]